MTDPAEPFPAGSTWRERRAARKASRQRERESARLEQQRRQTQALAAQQYADQLARWQFEHDELSALLHAAESAIWHTGGAEYGVLLKKSESALWAAEAVALIEPRRHPGTYSRGYSGVSVRIARGVRYHVGGSRGRYLPGPELQTPIDSGQAVLTTSRVVFKGFKMTREWRFDKLLGIDTSPDGDAVLLHVSNRQKVSGLVLGGLVPAFESFLGTAIAIAQNGAETVARELESSLSEHLRLRPSLPPGSDLTQEIRPW
ncbi:hypothetical protein FOH10_21100 [Nocardia otitidiscaviarum]|uniref:Uncharacterized protein n=1 Tax=Nocardia otitidiscaviarum TaxID=1823 RepID=A0A516NPM0_9NOCA|nr:hypothetical protein [Nocardia otitidiscaviarum]QDP80834.1 hypothetical protein FOH10_21100 [Nocardia otitidiscaviarum]